MFYKKIQKAINRFYGRKVNILRFLKFFEKNREKENLQKRDIPITPPVSDPLLRALIEGETITREKALTLPAVAGAVDLISSTIAS